MKILSFGRKNLALLAVLVPLLLLFLFVAFRSGPLAPVEVTVTTVENRGLAPALFGLGTVESRYTHKIGPTISGRIRQVTVQVGDLVESGQLLGEMDPVDFEARLEAQAAVLARSEALLAEAGARVAHARREAARYEELWQARATSAELREVRRQELLLAQAGQEAARQEQARGRAELDALAARRHDLRLLAPIAGLVVARHAEPGTTLVAGQAVVELIDPANVWVNARFDQVSARGLAAGLSATIVLRSRPQESLSGRVLRVEPLADAVTEEMLAKVPFAQLPTPFPPIGELAEVTVALPPLPPGPVIPNAAIQRLAGQTGVWRLVDGRPRFTPVEVGGGDLEGLVQIRAGLAAGEQVVLYSAKALREGCRLAVVAELPGAGKK